MTSINTEEKPKDGGGSEPKHDEQKISTTATNADICIYTDETTGLMILPEEHPEYFNLLRLQFENRELANWKTNLQAKIMAERAEILRLRETVINTAKTKTKINLPTQMPEEECTNFIAHYMKENITLQERLNRLKLELFEEQKSLIELRTLLELKNFKLMNV